MQTTKQVNYGVANRRTTGAKRTKKGYGVKRRRANRMKFIVALSSILVVAGSIFAMTTRANQPKEVKEYQVENMEYVEKYNISTELMHYIEKYCDEYNTDVDLVMAIADKKSNVNVHNTNAYGKGLLDMRPSTIEWVTEETGTFPGEIGKPQVAAKTAVFLVDYFVGEHGVEEAIRRICGNETDTVSEIATIYLENTGIVLFE